MLTLAQTRKDLTERLKFLTFCARNSGIDIKDAQVTIELSDNNSTPDELILGEIITDINDLEEKLNIKIKKSSCISKDKS